MTQENNIKSKVLSGLIWKFAERISAQLVTFIVSIILARLLDPSHYGAIAIVNVFIALANVFVVSGFGNSLIQKKDADNIDFSSVFWGNLVISSLVYMVIFISAPYIAEFYGMQILCPVLRVLGIRIIIGGINNVQQAYVSKNMMFKRFFWSTLFGTVISGVAGIILAYSGFGIWALTAQYLINSIVGTIVLWFTVSWRPVFKFSFTRLKILFSFGWKLLISALLDTGYKELRTLVIGKMYTSADLAFYNKGKSFPDLFVTNINSSIQSVLFPAMSNEQKNKDTLKAMVRRAIRISSYTMLPLMCGFALVAEPFIELLLTEKWLPCVPYLRIATFTFAFMPIHTANLQAINAIGRSDIYLRLEIIKKVIGLIALIVSAPYGVFAIAASAMLTTVIASFINAYPNKKLINYNYFEQMKDMLNSSIPLLAMIIGVYLINFLHFNTMLTLSLQILTGAFMYIVVSIITKNESFNYIFNMIKDVLKR